jgi:hypothetical protein
VIPIVSHHQILVFASHQLDYSQYWIILCRQGIRSWNRLNAHGRRLSLSARYTFIYFILPSIISHYVSPAAARLRCIIKEDSGIPHTSYFQADPQLGKNVLRDILNGLEVPDLSSYHAL